MLARRPHLLALFLAVGAAVLLLGCTASTQLVAPDLPLSGDDQEVTSLEVSNQEVFDDIEQSIVFISTLGGTTGSGIVLDDGWVLTNAHVVDRNTSVRVGRSDGEDLGLLPVHASDWTFDLALVGPLPAGTLPAVPRGVSGDLALGDRVLLLGFPDEDTESPTPTLTEGIVSRRRNVALGDFPFLQVDATIAPGQSGGAMVNGNGELVGITGLEFGQGEFGLVFATDAMWPRVDDLIANGSSQLPDGPGENELSDEVGPLRRFGFTIEVDESGEMNLDVDGTGDVYIDVQNLDGATVDRSKYPEDPFQGVITEGRLFIDDRADGVEQINTDIAPGTYQVIIGSFETTSSVVTVKSNNMMRQFADVEEGRTLPVGEVLEGTFDWAQDTDTWELPLEAGQQVTIVADGISDPVLAVRLDGELIVASDDEGLGLFGTGAQVDFVVDQDGLYEVQIGTFDTDRWGYLMQATVN